MAAYEKAGESDDWYTPLYLFDAMAERFDLDVAAPICPPTLSQAVEVPEVKALVEALKEYMEHDADYATLNDLGDHEKSHRWKRASAAFAALEGKA